MIQKVCIQNFKSLRDVTIELERFTVFVGANGSGKTSVLEAIHNAARAATGDPQKAFAHERHGDWIYTRGGVGDLSIRIETAGGAFSVEATPPAMYPPSPELMQKASWVCRPSGSQAPVSGAPLIPALEPPPSTVFLRLYAAVMAWPSYSRDDPPRVKCNGKGLASVLAYMALNDPQGFEDLVKEEMDPGELWSLFGENWLANKGLARHDPARPIGHIC